MRQRMRWNWWNISSFNSSLNVNQKSECGMQRGTRKYQNTAINNWKQLKTDCSKTSSRGKTALWMPYQKWHPQNTMLTTRVTQSDAVHASQDKQQLRRGSGCCAWNAYRMPPFKWYVADTRSVHHTSVRTIIRNLQSINSVVQDHKDGLPPPRKCHSCILFLLQTNRLLLLICCSCLEHYPRTSPPPPHEKNANNVA